MNVLKQIPYIGYRSIFLYLMKITIYTGYVGEKSEFCSFYLQVILLCELIYTHYITFVLGWCNMSQWLVTFFKHRFFILICFGMLKIPFHEWVELRIPYWGDHTPRDPQDYYVLLNDAAHNNFRYPQICGDFFHE